MHRPFRIRSIIAVSSAHPSKSKPASVTVSVAAFPVTVVPAICNTSAPQAAHGGESSAKMFPITHDNSAAVQAYRVSIRSSASSRSKCP
jgi:hypothetical protein